MKTAIYSIVAPVWLAWDRPEPALNRRRWLRWELVREVRQPTPDGLMTWAYEHAGYFWTWRAADSARMSLEAGR